MKVIYMKFLFALCVACNLAATAQEPNNKPKVSIKALAPEPVPAGSCKQDEFGYLDTSKGDNHWVPYTAAELGAWIADRVSKGFVVTIYPQPKGRLWVEITCAAK